MKSPFSVEGWIGIALGIFGIILIFLEGGNPSYIDFLGSICSIVGFTWALLGRSVERNANMITEEIRKNRDILDNQTSILTDQTNLLQQILDELKK